MSINQNMNELRSLVQSIKDTTRLADSKEYDDVRRYCVEKHNETRAILAEILDFVTDNMSVFNNPKKKWTLRASASNYGESNNLDSVVRCSYYAERGFFTYWLDGWVFFSVKHGEASFVSPMRTRSHRIYTIHGEKLANIETDRVGYSFFKWDYAHTTREMFLGGEWTDVPQIRDEFSAKDVKGKVDADHYNAVNAYKMLGWSLRRIKEDAERRLMEIDSVKDSSASVERTRLEPLG